MKSKTAYVCTECGYDSTKWLGRCPNCGAWDSFKEVKLGANPKSSPSRVGAREGASTPHLLSEVESSAEVRLDTHDAELNRVLGGGLVKGSLVLLGGEPGIGKSTLLLQTVLRMTDLKILYVSGEESEQQLKMRAERLSQSSMFNVQCSTLDSLYILCETSLERIYEQATALDPDLIIIDSVQAISTEQGEAFPGSLTQVRDCAVSLLRYVKDTGKSVILVGHITKDGSLAGPKVLEHIVDTVLHFEGDRHYMFRVLRGLKNRFGSTSELGIYEMQSGGLRPVGNPSEMLLSRGNEGLSGVAVAATIEGARPILIETQALVSSAAYGNAQRSATGFDIRRLNMLLAVLEKRAGFKLAQKDVFLNIA
ncbi:MAG: DNA repair protein RadA, partial [Bacteroidaceae bacterium]|nr:DNA repair protein RadA [Bacteroidaceae bacterium]